MSQNTFTSPSRRRHRRAVARYRKILGIEPARCANDYAQVRARRPARHLSLSRGGEPGTLCTWASLPSARPTSRARPSARRTKGSTSCASRTPSACYAKADKFLGRGRRRVRWEMYTLLEDIEHQTAPTRSSARSRPGGVSQEQPARIRMAAPAPPAAAPRSRVPTASPSRGSGRRLPLTPATRRRGFVRRRIVKTLDSIRRGRITRRPCRTIPFDEGPSGRACARRP